MPAASYTRDIAMHAAGGAGPDGEAIVLGLLYIGDRIDELLATQPAAEPVDIAQQEHVDRVLASARSLAEEWTTKPSDFVGLQESLDELATAVNS